MHVGPTNSGKTHHALRALAAAESGVYAGPLRLLAHEIFTRLNAGQIVPAGIDVSTLPPYTEPDTETNFDIDEKAPVVRKDGDPRFVRPCNMITGEEQRIVDDRAPLLASTIEMLGHSRRVNVAVIDEIQLIGDAQRGGAWTDAVLGLCADEIHLCGEESAVPIVERLLADTGDKLEVRRYQRLTPLVVAEKSLNEDFSKIEKGDCVVGFSRSAIFKLKNRIEKATGLRCAMAYGALPPEIRSEQAALFNDPDSGYDVLVGTDAIGMGLNLLVSSLIVLTTMILTNLSGRSNASSWRAPSSSTARRRNLFPFLRSSRSQVEQADLVFTGTTTPAVFAQHCAKRTCLDSEQPLRRPRPSFLTLGLPTPQTALPLYSNLYPLEAHSALS